MEETKLYACTEYNGQILILIFINTLIQVNSLFMKHDNFVIFVASKTKAFKVTTSNTRNLKGILVFPLQIDIVIKWVGPSNVATRLWSQLGNVRAYLMLIPRTLTNEH